MQSTSKKRRVQPTHRSTPSSLSGVASSGCNAAYAGARSSCSLSVSRQARKPAKRNSHIDPIQATPSALRCMKHTRCQFRPRPCTRANSSRQRGPSHAAAQACTSGCAEPSSCASAVCAVVSTRSCSGDAGSAASTKPPPPLGARARKRCLFRATSAVFFAHQQSLRYPHACASASMCALRNAALALLRSSLRNNASSASARRQARQAHSCGRRGRRTWSAQRLA